MIQDIAPHSFDNQIVFAKPAAHDRVLVYRDRVAGDPHNSVLVRQRDAAKLDYPTFAELDTDCPCVYAFSVDGERFFIARPEKDVFRRLPPQPEGYGFAHMKDVRESAEREVREEVGLRVKNIRYYRSQPWGYASNLLLGYFCELDGDATITLQEDELGYGAWVSRDEITEEEDGVSLTSEMIARFKRGDLPFSK